MRFLALLFVLLLNTQTFGQVALWEGRWYSPNRAAAQEAERMGYHNVIIFSKGLWHNCPMCQTLREDWAISSNTPTSVSLPLSVAILQTSSISPSIEYITETRYRTERVKVGQRCINGVCIPQYENRQVAYQVQIPIQATPTSPPSIEIDPTPAHLAPCIIGLLNLTKDDKYIDIGSGTGILTKEALKSDAEVYGIEINKDLANKLHTELYGKATIYHGDATSPTDYSPYNKVSFYSAPHVLEGVVPQLKPGTLIVSYGHEIPGVDNQVHWLWGSDIYTATVPFPQLTEKSILEVPQPTKIPTSSFFDLKSSQELSFDL